MSKSFIFDRSYTDMVEFIRRGSASFIRQATASFISMDSEDSEEL